METEISSWFPESVADYGGIDSADFGGAKLPEIPGYVVVEVLGRGGAGIVYLANHCGLGRPVAIKMLLAGRFAQLRDLDRFWREAKSLAALRHANIVQVYDLGSYEGRPYFSMEFLEGGTLAKRLAANPQPARQAARLVATLADAIHAAHQDGIIHRDLTPANVLFAADGTRRSPTSDCGAA